MDFTLIDGVIVMVTSLVIVFLALVILQFVIEVMHRFIQRKEKAAPSATDHTEEPFVVKDEETELAAALMALILANEDQQNKSYQITEIKRIH